MQTLQHSLVYTFAVFQSMDQDGFSFYTKGTLNRIMHHCISMATSKLICYNNFIVFETWSICLLVENDDEMSAIDHFYITWHIGDVIFFPYNDLSVLRKVMVILISLRVRIVIIKNGYYELWLTQILYNWKNLWITSSSFSYF